MANMVIECPACGKPVRAGTGLFSKKKIRCACGYEIDVASERLATKMCPHCGNEVVYDRTKSEQAVCPVCHEKINAGKLVTITCPGCSTELKVDSNAKNYTCPQCKTLIDVQGRIQQAEKAGKVNHIKWDMGQNGIFIYRHPVENFAFGTMLTVKEGQKAIFFRDGRGLDIFGPGRHILETENVPLLKSEFATDQDMLYSAQVYFVRTNRLDIKWGVPETEFRDPQLNFYVKMFSRGSATIQVKEDDSSIRKFLYMMMDTTDGTEGKAVGGGEGYDITYIQNKFRSFIASRFSDLITQVIIENEINILDMNSKKGLVAKMLCPKLNAVLEDYGLTIPNEELFLIDIIGYANSPEIEKWKQQESDRKLKVREQEVLKAEAEAIQGRVLTEEETEAKRRILRAQGAGEEAKIAASARGEAVRLETVGNTEAMKLKAEGEGEAERLKAMGSSEALKMTAGAESEAMKLRASGEAEEVRLPGMAEAEVQRAAGMAEADIMHAKGYTYQEETSRELGKEVFKNGLPGTGQSSGGIAGNVGGTFGEMAGLGVSLAAMGSVMNMAKDTLKPVTESFSGVASVNNYPDSGSGWSCANCGTTKITSNFCPNCGSQKPQPKIGWTCPSCGKSDIITNFCPDCGASKPVQNASWICSQCGMQGITSNFCPQCGKRKGD